MANNRLIFLQSDSDPKAIYTLFDVNRDVDINIRDPETQPWIKFSEWNKEETLFTILGIKQEGGFDGQVQYRFVNESTDESLLKDLDAGNYQGEIFLSYSTDIVGVEEVDDEGIFTSLDDTNLAQDDKIWFQNVPELPELSATEWTVNVLSANTFSLQEEWEFPDDTVVFAEAQFFNITITETSVHRAPIILKAELT